MRKLLNFGFALILVACSGGYSFTGGDVGDAQTISIAFFPNNAALVQPQLSQIFTEKLRDIFLQQTRLELVKRDGDMDIEGSIIGYDIQPLNAQASDPNSFTQQVAQTRISVTVNVIFTNVKDPDKSFEQRFNRFADFPSDQELSTVEVELLDQISQELSENILNQAIGDW
jgi:hypothetical protein